MNLKPRLSFMMFLQYGIWGAWLPLLYPFLMGHRGFSLDQVGMIMAAGAVGAILGPFLAGQVADRWLATEKFLAFCHIIGAGLVWMLATTADYSSFLWLSLLYGLVYAPTLALTNSLAFHHLEDRDRDFGPIRLWGTIGWIAVGIGVGQWLLHMHTPADATAELIAAAQDAGRADAFKLSAILGVIMGLYCFTLPHTPPSKSPAKKNATFEALGEIRMQPLITLFLVSVPLSVIHQFYFVHTSQFLSVLQRSDAAAEGFANSINSVLGVGGGGLMTIGQMMEIPVLAIIPFIAKKVSRKSLLTFGLVAYAARMALFAYVGDSMAAVLLGVALHGLCFGCFIFVAFMVVDEQTTDDVRASAQNLYNLVIIGIGIIVGSWFAANIVGNWAMEGDVMNYTKLFSVPMWMALACVVFMLAFYPRGERKITLQ
ncbi:MAG: nucleoside permease [Planctomycetes bacterium]|nr:nucleoside permease [Planctomycetota bacterium]MCP4861370.1 nucleoside permease [Planctomycetota bacterium]